MIYTESMPSTIVDQSRVDGVNEALGLIEAAIFKLGPANEGPSCTVNPNFDPDPFKFVERLVRDEDWGKSLYRSQSSLKIMFGSLRAIHKVTGMKPW